MGVGIGAAVVGAQDARAQDPKAWPDRTFEVAQRPQTPPAGAPQTPPGVVSQAPPKGGVDIGAVNRDFGQSETSVLNKEQLILIAPPEQVEALKRLIEDLDRASGFGEPGIQQVRLKHADSAGLARLLTSIYQAKQDARTPETGTAVTNAGGRVGFIALAQPNSIVVVAKKSEIDEIVKTVKDLDEESKPGQTYKVFPLKKENAAQLVTKLNSFFNSATATAGQPAQAQPAVTPANLRARVEIVSDIRNNAVIVFAGPADMLLAEEVIKLFDEGIIKSKVEVRYFTLKNGVAADVANLLVASVLRRVQAAAGQTTTGAGGAAGQQFNQLQNQGAAGAATSVGSNLPVTPAGMRLALNTNRVIESGILENITVTPDTRTNSLLVTAPAESMTLLAELISQIDAQENPAAQVKVFELKNADANAMLTTLRNFLAPQSAQTGGQFGGQQFGGQQFGGGQFGGQNQQGQMPPTFRLGDMDASLSLVPLNFSVDQRTNSLLVTGTPNDILVVEALITKLDSNTARERKTFVYRLNNITADEASTAIENFIQSQAGGLTSALGGQGGGLQQGLLTLQQQIAQDVVVVSEPATNQLLISASPRYFDQVLKTIQTIDRRPPQVVISVLIAEVTLTDNEEFGIEFGVQSSNLFDRNITTNNQLVPGVNFNTVNPLPSAVGAPFGSTGFQGLSNFALGRGNAAGFGGFIFSASSQNVSVLLRALKRQQRLDVLSSPKVMTQDNRLAQLLVGQRVPLIRNSVSNNSTNGNIVNTFEYEDVGIQLQVVPQINPDGTVVMSVNPQVSALDQNSSVPISVDSAGRVVASAPLINITNLNTIVAAADGQTVVLGGLISRARNRDVRKIPHIGDWPLLGWLWRTDFYTVAKRELLIILTPKIIYCDSDIETVKSELASKISWCLPDVRAVHGDPFIPGTPGPDGKERCTTAIGMPVPDSARLEPIPPNTNMVIPPQLKQRWLEEGRLPPELQGVPPAMHPTVPIPPTPNPPGSNPPPGALPPGAVPPGVAPSGTIPPAALPPGAVPPNSIPPGPTPPIGPPPPGAGSDAGPPAPSVLKPASGSAASQVFRLPDRRRPSDSMAPTRKSTAPSQRADLEPYLVPNSLLQNQSESNQR